MRKVQCLTNKSLALSVRSTLLLCISRQTESLKSALFCPKVWVIFKKRWIKKVSYFARGNLQACTFCPPPHGARKGDYWIRHRLPVCLFTLNNLNSFLLDLGHAQLIHVVHIGGVSTRGRELYSIIKAGDSGATRTLVSVFLWANSGKKIKIYKID